MQHQRLRDITVRDPARNGSEVRTITGERLQVLHQHVPANAAVRLHRHDNEQMTLVLSGRLRALVADQEIIVGPQEIYIVPANIEHSSEAIEDTVLVEVFAPPRLELA